MMRSKHLYSILILGIFLISSGYQLHSLFQTPDNKNLSGNGITSNNNIQILPQNSQITGNSGQQQNNANKALISGIEQVNPNNQNTNEIGSGNTKANTNSLTGTILQGVNDSLWYNNDWKYRKNITVLSSAFSSSYNNFPLLIDIYDSGLKLALDSGNDILFTDAQNNKLPHEIESFNRSYSSTQAHLRVWVKGNFSNTANTVLMMYFGNPFSSNQQNAPAVWNNNYIAVYHLSGDPSKPIIDSTGHYNATGYAGTNVMPSSNLATGQIGNAVSFNGVNERILANNIMSSGTWSGVTLEAWINSNSLTSSTDIVGKEAASGSPVIWDMYLSKKQVNFLFSTDLGGGSIATSANAVASTGTWYQLASTWNASTSQTNIYVDGSQKGSGTIAGSLIYDASPYSTIIGGSPDGSSYLFNGLIDEVRISNVSRSANWLKDQYNNALNPSSYYSISPSVDQLQLKLNWSINQLDYRKNIIINHLNTNQTLNNYVFPIHLIDSDLHAHAQANGGDIIFTDANGTRLDFQIESYNNNYDSTHSDLMAWVMIPTISNTSDTSIFMYYGNSSVVHPDFGTNLWKSYSAVWHLSEVVTEEQNVSYAYVDSTGNGNYGNQTGTSTTNAVLGRGQYFDGNDKISIKSSTMATGNNGIITGWFNLKSPFTSTNTSSEVILSKYASATNNAHLALVGTDYTNTSVPRGSLVFKDEQTNQVFTWTNQTSWLANTWYQFTIIFNKNNPTSNKIYINGVDDTNGSTLCSSCTIGLNFAGSWTFGGGTVDTEIPGGQAYFIGSLDEIRIENSVPSSNEILFTYKSEVNNSAYFVQNQFVFDYTPPVLLNFGAEDSGTGVATYWASFYDKAGVKSAFIQINNSAHELTFNGSLWIFVTNPSFNDYYNYSMVNATDIQGNFGVISSTTKNITFNVDKQAPTVYSWTYNPNIGNNGTFYAQVIDNWGMVDSVEVIIATAPVKMPNPNYAFMKYNSSSGYYETGSIYMVGQSISFKIFANDTFNNNITTITHSATVNNRAPTVSNPILQSGSGSLHFSNLTLTLSYTYSDPENDANLSQIYWYKNGQLQTLYTNSLAIPKNALIKNDNWTAVIEAYDGHQFGNNVSISAIILNSAPNVTASLNTVDSSTALTALYSYSDDDNDIMKGFTIIWYKNGVEVTGLYNLTSVDPSYTTRGEQWNFTIQVFDGQAYSQIIASNTIIIANSKPIATNVSFNSTSVSNTDTVNITYTYFDNDNDPQNISLRKVYWFVNGVYNATLNDVTVLYPFNRTNNAFYYYIVTVSDGYVGANYTSIGISIGSITNSYPPSATGLTIELTTTGQSCETINCTALDSIKIYYLYSDPDGNAQFGTKIAWFLNSTGSFVLQSQYNDTIILPVGALKKGEQWIAMVTPSDGKFYGTPVNSSIITIKNIKPVVTPNTSKISVLISGSYTVSSITYTDNTLYASWQATDGDNDTIVAYQIYWFNGSNEISWNENYLPSNFTSKGETWSFIVKVFDGQSWSDNATSSSISILDTAPQVINVALSGGLNTSTDLTVSYTFVDPDNDINNSQITWWVYHNVTSGFVQVGGNTITLSSSYFVAGDLVYATITPNDGQLSGNQVNSITILIGDSAPQIAKSGTPEIVIYGNNNDTNMYANSTLYVYFNATDPDGIGGNYGLYSQGSGYYIPGVGAEYKWYKNGLLQINLISNTVPSQYLKKGDFWIVSVRVIDKFGDYSPWTNISSPIEISNSAPVIQSISWFNQHPTSQDNVQITITKYDIDSDSIQTKIRWFVNRSGIITEIFSNENNTILQSNNFVKNDYVFVMVTLSDGYNVGLSVNSTQILIGNSLPVVTSIEFNNGKDTYTNDSLTVTWGYNDPDSDVQNKSMVLIQWYKNGNHISSLDNLTVINSTNTAKGEVWYVYIQVFDGENYSNVFDSRSFTFFIIKNSPPIVLSISINNNQITYTDTPIQLDYQYFDIDGDAENTSAIIIYWYENSGSGWFLLTGYGNQTSLPTSLTSKGDVFRVEIRVYDGSAYSVLYISANLTISNKAASATGIGFIFSYQNLNSTAQRSFFLSDENVNITYSYFDADNDPDASTIYWYRNGKLVPELNNSEYIPMSYLQDGDRWNYIIYVSDGFITNSPVNSSIITIISTPKIWNVSSSPPDPSTNSPEGVYDFTITANNTDSSIVKLDVNLDPNLQTDPTIKTLLNTLQGNLYSVTNHSGDKWFISGIKFYSTDPSIFTNYMGKTVVIQIVVYIDVFDISTGHSFRISRTKNIFFILKDDVAPRVNGVTVTFDNNNNPQFVTFSAQIEDFGSGIENATIYYYFSPLTLTSTTSGTSKLYSLSAVVKLPAGYQSAVLKLENGEYKATVPFYSNKSVDILFQIAVVDKAGNSNIDAYPNGLNPDLAKSFQYKPAGLAPEQVALIIGLILIIALVGTFVGIRKFRKTEIVGLDVDRVMDEVPTFRDSDIQPDLTKHTLGIIISIFHQSLGPMPIFAIPSILTDNLEKLIDLSDISFSTVRFVENFDTEKQTYFDYNISSAISVTSLSYGFSLNRPEARGGSENITLNILLHKPYDTIIGQFTEKIDPFIHEIHGMLDREEGERETIEKLVQDLRNFITKIILSYERMYPDQAIEDLVEF